MDQHDEIMEALFLAKERNVEEAMNLYKNEIVEVNHAEFKSKKCSLRDAVMSLNYSYYFESVELERVVNIINNIK